MSLIAQLSELKKSCDAMKQSATRQQEIYFLLIEGLVRLHQKHRVAKNYAASDEMRDLLSSVGVKVAQGTDGYAYDEIPSFLKGRPVNDTWTID